MPDFLLELFSEEIPARMQAAGASALGTALVERLAEVQMRPAASQLCWTPRRVTVQAEGLPERQPDRAIETRGPRVGSPAAALAGFLRAAGLTSVEQCEIRETSKGRFYFAARTEPGRSIVEVLAALIPEVLDRMTWPKSMRWAGHSVRWVRPLHNILAIVEDAGRTEIVPARWLLDRGKAADPAVLEANDATFGHRFMAPRRLRVTGFADYRAQLRAAHVLLDAAERKDRILAEGARLAAAEGLRVTPDPALLDEVSGLVEWPVVRLGRIEPRFMALPPELLTTSMRTHQKYFACETESGALAPFFVVVANNEPRDGGVRMVLGNERVLRARLSDAQFFWDQDRRRSLESRIATLGERVFHAKLGSVLDKVERMARLADVLARFVPGADPDQAVRAVRLAKADLLTALVGEFPELQGLIGRYLALHDGEAPAVAEAIARHYAPAGLADATPAAPLDIVAALADKLDTLAGFFAIGELPTGSKDPYALRRAGLGILRILLENGLRLPLRPVFGTALSLLAEPPTAPAAVAAQLLDFLADRLKAMFRERGFRHDLVSAVWALGGDDDLVRLVARVEALRAFLATEDGASLLTAYRRAARIVQIEAKKDGIAYADHPIDEAGFDGAAEHGLFRQLTVAAGLSDAALEREEFGAAMSALASLRRPLDAFFAEVTVNADRPALRANRLGLLARIAQAFDRVADFSKIEG